MALLRSVTRAPAVLINSVKVFGAQKIVSMCHWLLMDEIHLFTLPIAGFLQSQAGSEQQFKDSIFDYVLFLHDKLSA